MYLYIYTVYVIVEHEMWLLHFIFEGLFVYFFQNCRQRCYIKAEWDDYDGERASEEEKWSKTSCKEKSERAIALIAYEDISDGGGVYNN